MTQEALKLALEALEGMYIQGFTMDNSPINNAITAIKEALAQPEQEPVIDKSAAIRIATALGWSPQRTWQGLTDEEISELIRATHNTGSFVCAIEAKLKEKNCAG